MDGHPGSPAHGVANDVLDGHVGAELGAVRDVGRLTVGRVGAADVVMVARNDNGATQALLAHGAVEGLCDLATTL